MSSSSESESNESNSNSKELHLRSIQQKRLVSIRKTKVPMAALKPRIGKPEISGPQHFTHVQSFTSHVQDFPSLFNRQAACPAVLHKKGISNSRKHVTNTCKGGKGKPMHQADKGSMDVLPHSGEKTAETLPKTVFMHFQPRLAIAFSKFPEIVAEKLFEKKLITTSTWEDAKKASLSPQSRANTLVEDTQTTLSSDRGDKNLRKLCKIISHFPEMKRLSAKIMDKYERALSRDGEMSSTSESESSESDSDSGNSFFDHHMAKISEKELDPSHFDLISKSLHGLSKWQDLAVNLDMDIEDSLLECIEEDCHGDVNECREVLLLWWLHSGRATKSSLEASCPWRI